LGFPQALHDDQVDSVSQFLKWASPQALYDDVDLGVISVGRHDPYYPYCPIQNW